MKFYQEVETPQTVYIHEVTYWIAFGRVPEWTHSTDIYDVADIRGDEHAELDHMCCAFTPHYFDLVEHVPDVLDGVDADGFNAVLIQVGGDSVEEIKSKAQDAKRFATEHATAARIATIETDALNEISIATTIERTRENLDIKVERAQAKLFCALSDGRLTAVAQKWHIEKGGEWDVIHGTETVVPTKDWRLSEIDWHNANLGEVEDGTPRWVACRINFNEMMAVFPKPDILESNITVSQYGCCLVRDEAAASSRAPRQPARGRRAHADGAIKTAVERHFTKQLKGSTESKHQRCCI